MTTLEKYYSDMVILDAESDKLEARTAELEVIEGENEAVDIELAELFYKMDVNFEATCNRKNELFLELKDRTELTDEEHKMKLQLIEEGYGDDYIFEYEANEVKL